MYERGNDKYTTTLGLTDVQRNINKYYKLQLLKHDKSERFWVFRKWGRIGTTQGGNKLEEKSTLSDALLEFKQLYREKSGNDWDQRHKFVKRASLLYPIDIDHGGDQQDTNKNLLQSNIESKLKPPVQDLMRLIFDIEEMKKVMMEYEIDLDKMPLGKLSKKQITDAYNVLKELQVTLTSKPVQSYKIIDATNRFYTLVPHVFGHNEIKMLDSEQDIKMKCEMLENLMEMEIAYSMLHADTDKTKNPLDAHYKQLKTEIDVLDRKSQEFKMIEAYVKNTHADTHRQYELIIEDVYKVKRQGEDKRFKKFKKMHNRRLLWHGSRTTNFAGILSQGLRIAPPEAPVTGYMFGKGIYFADMVSKSANYCATSSVHPTGLLMLCEVALGDMYERYHADYIEKLPTGKHSCVGLGATTPNPQQFQTLEGDITVPCGLPTKATLPTQSSLLYNEYIVYDVAQVQAKYLLKMKFKYNV